MDTEKKEVFNRFLQESLIKSSDLPSTGVTPEQKAALNRKGNELFNKGDLETAKRIFKTTGYSDGLTRVGEVLEEQGKSVEALQLYWLAHNKRKSDPLVQKLAYLIRSILTGM